MSIRKAVCGLGVGVGVGITLSTGAQAVLLFQLLSAAPAVSQVEHRIPEASLEADGAGGNPNYLSWNRSLNVILPLAAGYFDMLPLFEDFVSPSTGLYHPLLGENEDFDANISGFVQDEGEFENLFVIPDLFMQAEWQPTENSLQSAPFTPHSYSGNVARARNTASACMQARDVQESKSGLGDSNCIEAGSGESGSVANRSGSRVGSGPRLLSARSTQGGGTVDGASGGGGEGGPGDGRAATAPGIGESGNGGGMFSPGSNNSGPDNSSEGNPSGAEGGGSNQGNGNNGTGESSGGGGGTGGNEDWGNGNGDTGNWNNPGEGEGPPPSEVAIIPEPATLALLASGLAALWAVRRNQGKTVC
ncbi:MAG TPA: PEP-CTERM sorting domain-containing protein [Nitrosospira sp.]|nr:PEP-CTERM sorting domain-containing protein [Nitrosospira sp.]